MTVFFYYAATCNLVNHYKRFECTLCCDCLDRRKYADGDGFILYFHDNLGIIYLKGNPQINSDMKLNNILFNDLTT